MTLPVTGHAISL